MQGSTQPDHLVLVRPTLEETYMHQYFVDQLLPELRQGAGAGIRDALRRLKLPQSFATQGQGTAADVLSARDFGRIIAALQRERRDELWGLGRKPLPYGTFAFLCRSMIQERTVGEAIEVGLRIFHLMTDDIRISLKCDGDLESLRIVLQDRSSAEPAPNATALQGFLVVSVIAIITWISGTELTSTAITVTSKATPESSKYFRLYSPEIHHSAETTSVRIDRSLMRAKINPTTLDIPRFAQGFIASMLGGYRNEMSTRERVLSILRKYGNSDVDQAEVSRALGMSTATLRRRLRDEGVMNLSALKDAYRQRTALSMLKRTDLPLEGISQALGFSEMSAFHRAFKRWTAQAPGQYRAKQHKGAVSIDVTHAA